MNIRVVCMLVVALAAHQSALACQTLNTPPSFYEMQLRTDKYYYSVGDSTTYEVVQGPARGFVLWWSEKFDPDKGFVNTGEKAAYYGQITSGNAWIGDEPPFHWRGTGTPWKCEDVGTWRKVVEVISGDASGPKSAEAFFMVSPGKGTLCPPQSGPKSPPPTEPSVGMPGLPARLDQQSQLQRPQYPPPAPAMPCHTPTIARVIPPRVPQTTVQNAGGHHEPSVFSLPAQHQKRGLRCG